MAQNLRTRGIKGESLDAREDRLINDILTEGLFQPGDEFRVQQQASPNMTVRVGSGTVGDRYVVEGPGGVFIVRNRDGYVGSGNADVAIANGDPTFDRIDGIDLVVWEDDTDSSGKTVAEIVVTQGTPSSLPSAPALPTGVAAVARLATVLVEAGESTAITSGDITDLRVASSAWTRPRGLVGFAERSTDLGPFTTDTDLGLTVTAPFEPGRRYRLSAAAAFQSSVAGDHIGLRIATDIGTVLATASGVSAVANRSATIDVSKIAMLSAPGTVKLVGTRFAGTGNITLKASATLQAHLEVEDVGGFLP